MCAEPCELVHTGQDCNAPDTLHTAVIYSVAGNTLYEKEEFAGALTMYLESLRIYRLQCVDGSKQLIRTLCNVGRTYTATGRCFEAYETFREIISHVTSGTSPVGLNCAMAELHVTHMRLLFERKSYASALAHMERSMLDVTACLCTGCCHVEEMLHVAGLVKARQGNFGAAEQFQVKALEMLQPKGDLVRYPHLQRYSVLNELGVVRTLQKRYPDAIRDFVRAEWYALVALGGGHRVLGVISLNAGLCRWREGDLAGCIDDLQFSQRNQRGNGDVDAVAETQRYLDMANGHVHDKKKRANTIMVVSRPPQAPRMPRIIELLTE
jgi:tetratricopeptide (TPR) repeat protein